MVNCFSEQSPVKIPNFSHFRKSFLYTPCNCPVVNCEFSDVQQPERKPRSYRTTRRIRRLAKPKQCTRKFHPRPVTQYGRTIERIQAYKEPYASTRLQQLALPKVRKLIAARDEYRKFIRKCWFDRFGKRIKRSMFTVYSRLANVQLPPERPKPVKMSPEQWKKHQQWLAKNALAKVAKKPKIKARKKMTIDDLWVRIVLLSVPRAPRTKFAGPPKPQYVKPAALKAPTSDHVRNLCIPKERHRREKGRIKEPTGLPEEVLKAVASSRVVELAQHKVYRNVRNFFKDNPFSVEPRALKAKASDRILELAKPKKRK
ncbi:uncharacterized protein LOC129744695 [Uranotaenia lowii]|uniref:uncharacterized protein LOC129744695 n=1 Tax=Uranotaenia lowii TaxID=190385 RepID=UPI002479A5C4|nr:uncharacterized protein LOC129744695 [Uranotaenia lowii]